MEESVVLGEGRLPEQTLGSAASPALPSVSVLRSAHGLTPSTETACVSTLLWETDSLRPSQQISLCPSSSACLMGSFDTAHVTDLGRSVDSLHTP